MAGGINGPAPEIDDLGSSTLHFSEHVLFFYDTVVQIWAEDVEER